MSVDVALIVIGGSIIVLGLASTVIKRVILSVPLLALVAGVVLGPELFGVLRPEVVGPELKVLEELTRVTLSVSLVATGLQMTRDDLRINASRVGLLLTIGMLGMWAMTSLGAHLLLGVDLWVALLIGAILTPTDPVVASALVEGKLAESNLPRWLRRSLQLESGSNDGLALAFVLIPALMLAWPDDDVPAIGGEILKQLALAISIGATMGGVTAKLLDFVEDHEDVSAGFFFVCALAMGLLVLGTTHLLGGTGVLASFIAGVTFSLAVEERYAQQLEQVQSGMERLLIVPVFLMFGALLPWGEWLALGWPGLAFGLWVLCLRRPAPVALALTPTGTPRAGVAFLSWYGPLGVAAIYYATFTDKYGFAEYEQIFAACALAVTVSVVGHTLTSTPGVRAYAHRSLTATLRHPLRKDIDAAP